jgi:Icc-related predicted phosphoesterase
LTLQLVATADVHGHLPHLPDGDVLVIAGDVCPPWDHSKTAQRQFLEGPFTEWLRAQLSRFGGGVVGIGGNHDFALEDDEELARSLPWRYLLNETIECAGITIHGIPHVPRFNDWAFMDEDENLKSMHDKIPDVVAVVLSHGPPHGSVDRNVFGIHVGSKGLRDRLAEIDYGIVVCGHIHEAYGRKPRHFNVSHMTRDYRPMNDPQVIDLDV